MDNYTILIWSPQASIVTELQDSNIYCVHLHHCSGETRRGGTSSWVIVNLTKATTHEAFFWMEGANDLFSLMVEVIPSSNSKNGSLCRGCKYIKWENRYRL